MKKRILSITAALAVVAAVAVAIWWFTRPVWPEFPAAKANEPQVVLKVDRDYAHHLGDLIVVDVFVRQQPGTTVDPKSLSVGGDFELAQKPELSQKELKDGSQAYRFRLSIQSFKVKKAQVLEGSIGYRVADKRQDLTIPPLELHTSNTWDGREALMEGDDPRVPAYWYTLRHAIPLALSSILFLVLTAVALRRWLKSLQKEPVIDHERKRVEELLALIKEGKCTKAQHLELDGLMRDRFKVGPIPAGQLEGRMLEPALVKFLVANEPAVYAEDALGEEARTNLLRAAFLVLTRWK